MNFLRQIAHILSQAVIQRLRQWTKPDNHILVTNAAQSFQPKCLFHRNHCGIICEAVGFRRGIVAIPTSTVAAVFTGQHRYQYLQVPL